MIIRHPRHPNHLSQDLDSISRTFLEQFVLVIEPRFIVDHSPPLLGSNSCLENLNAMADEYTHSMLVTDVDFDVHAPSPILTA